MQNAVLTYWREGGLPKFFELQPGTVALSLALDGVEITAGPPPATGTHVADLRYAEGICSVTLYSTPEPILLEQMQHQYTPSDRTITARPPDPNARPIGSTAIAQPTDLVLESGDTLWIGMFAIRFIQNSRYLQYLPAPYHAQQPGLDPAPQFTGRFLNIFESVLDPLSLMLTQIDRYFSPHTAPASILPYLSSWFDLEMPGPLATAEQRTVLQYAVEINRWRSTRHGLGLHIQAATGIEPEIAEWYAAADGPATPIAGALPRWMHQRGSIRAPRGAQLGCVSILLPLDSAAARVPQPIERLIHSVDAIIRMHRPVHSTYEIWVQATSSEQPIRHIPSARDQQ